MSCYVVHFHADGGQMCVPGRRCTDSLEAAEALVGMLQDEPGHHCGPDSLRIEELDSPIGNEGYFVTKRDEYGYRRWAESLESLLFHYNIKLGPD